MGFHEQYVLSASTPLGAGQFGVVYQAAQRSTGRQVAVKVIAKDRPDRPRCDYLPYIKQEVALWQACQGCPYVVRLHAVFEDDTQVYMVQELCAGGDLQRLLLKVMATCHAARHLYGDCKPANFLLLNPYPPSDGSPWSLARLNSVVPYGACLEFRSRVVSSGDGDASPAPAWLAALTQGAAQGLPPDVTGTLSDEGGDPRAVGGYAGLVVLGADFGCCQPLVATGGTRRAGTSCGKRIGSPVYMAPEMWQSEGQVGTAVDVWAAGVMLYQLLSGRYPFWAMRAEEVDSGGLHLWQLVCGVQSLPLQLKGAPWSRVSGPCKHLITAMLNRDPRTRLSVAAALQHPWFEQQLGGDGSAAARPPVTAHATAACSSGSP